MYRLEIDMFLDYLEKGSHEGAASAFSKKSFMKEISSRMESWKSIKETNETYIKTFESITSKLDGLHDEFVRFTSKFCTESDNFKFWHQYIHKDCMAYICLYLAGRSGNWELRNYALKSMMPLFHVVNSNFYYKLLPRHFYDLVQLPSSVLSNFQAGGFVTSLKGIPWSSLFLDETHETTINKEVKEVASSLSPASLSAKNTLSTS